MGDVTPKLIPVLTAVLVLASGGAAVEAQARPSAAARMTACATSAAQPGRYLVADGTMRTLKGASRMQIRFELQSRTRDRPAWHTLVAPGFGVWNTAGPGVRRYVYEKRVEALAAPAGYRMVVQFRWLNGSRSVAQQRRVTGVCEQPDRRADLVPRKLSVKGPRRYELRLDNTGGSASGPFSVVMNVNGAALPGVAVAGLKAGGSTTVVLPGPRCVPGSSMVARVDPDGRVDERDEAANELATPCPG